MNDQMRFLLLDTLRRCRTGLVTRQVFVLATAIFVAQMAVRSISLNGNSNTAIISINILINLALFTLNIFLTRRFSAPNSDEVGSISLWFGWFLVALLPLAIFSLAVFFWDRNFMSGQIQSYSLQSDTVMQIVTSIGSPFIILSTARIISANHIPTSAILKFWKPNWLWLVLDYFLLMTPLLLLRYVGEGNPVLTDSYFWIAADSLIGTLQLVLIIVYSVAAYRMVPAPAQLP